MAARLGLAEIQAAARALSGRIERTPLVHSPVLAGLTGAEVFLKLENLQVSGSFKARGALNRMLALSPAERQAGVVTMSAGNHAQGVAWHARALGIPATIVMPAGTPFTKIERTEALGACVILNGASLTEAAARAAELAATQGLTMVHPYDDARVIAGQGTIGLELAEDDPGLDALIVPVGGGGLIAGIATALAALKPKIEVIGVQSALYPSMKDALEGVPPRCGGQTLAEGIAVKMPGVLCRDILRQTAADILLVDDPPIERAIQLLLDGHKLLAEGAAAAPLAALLSHGERFRGRRVGLVVSGGNIDARLIASILLRGLARAGRLARLRIEIPDAPGTLARVARLIGEGDGNIIEIFHQRLFHDVPVKFAELDAVIETTSTAHVDAIVELLRREGYPTRLLSNTAAE